MTGSGWELQSTENYTVECALLLVQSVNCMSFGIASRALLTYLTFGERNMWNHRHIWAVDKRIKLPMQNRLWQP